MTGAIMRSMSVITLKVAQLKYPATSQIQSDKEQLFPDRTKEDKTYEAISI
jgi:hypothetical protein